MMPLAAEVVKFPLPLTIREALSVMLPVVEIAFRLLPILESLPEKAMSPLEVSTSVPLMPTGPVTLSTVMLAASFASPIVTVPEEFSRSSSESVTTKPRPLSSPRSTLVVEPGIRERSPEPTFNAAEMVTSLEVKEASPLLV